MNKTLSKEETKLENKGLFLLMAISCGIVVANLYYNQPLLSDIAISLHIPQKATGLIPMLTQLGYASGMLFIVPLIDMTENKRLMLIMLGLSTLSLLAMSFASSITPLNILSYCLGLTSVAPQMLIPMAASYANEKNRGKVIGFVMTGLLSGILLSRTVAGILDQHYGWHAPFAVAAALNAFVAVLLAARLPKHHGTHKESYAKLLHSLVHIVRTHPKLRKSSLIIFFSFALFTMIWTILSFYLSAPPFNYPTGIIGLFSILAIGGAAAANISGRYADKRGANFTLNIGILCLAAGYIVLLVMPNAVWVVILSIFLIDFGHQTNHISNQSVILSLSAEARGRMNTVYMAFMFTGGALGSIMANYAWSAGGINGVSICAVACCVLVYAIFRFWKV